LRLRLGCVNEGPFRIAARVIRDSSGECYYKAVTLVGRSFGLHRKLTTASIPADKKLYQRQIETTDRQIDALVYELYDLTEQEIAIVEEATRQGAAIASDTVAFLAAHQGRPLKLLLAFLGV